jgi:hypothetical protein
MDTKRRRELAARWIEENGWRQGYTPDGENGGCLVTALNRSGVDGDELRESADEIRSELGINLLSVWNDVPGRTKEEVLAALRGTLRGA